jgi:3-methyladenine DNA glycosylase AlkD
MPEPTVTPAKIVAEIRSTLKLEGSAEHAKSVQWFFKEEIRSHGWYTADLRRLATHFRRTLGKEQGLEFLVRVADRLFTGRILEEKIVAVFLLERSVSSFDEEQFTLFESWIDRISSWADHDGLVHYLIAPLVMAKPQRVARVFKWAQSPDRWHRRAACVALIHGTRRRQFFPKIRQLSNMLLQDEDDMVQKGLGWLLRETAKADAKQTIPYLLTIRRRAPRLILRTACETLSQADKTRILS